MVSNSAMRLGALGLLAALGVACASNGARAGSGSGGASASGGSSGSGGSGGSGSGGSTSASGDAGAMDAAPDGPADGDADAGAMPTSADKCDEVPTPRRTSGALVELPITAFLGDQPFVYGEWNPLGSLGTVTSTNFRFYVSNVALVRAGGETVPVDIVAASGAPEAFDVHLFNADDPASQTLRLLAPSGDYTGVEFILGLNDTCNGGRQDRNDPLSPTSEMTWGPPLGYLFLRYEGRSDGTISPRPPSMIHMGGFPGTLMAPKVRVDGRLAVPGSGKITKGLRVAIDEIFKGATVPVDISGAPLPPETAVDPGENLRRSATGLHIFTFDP